MKIIITGTRGIPNIQGGIESHCEELFPRIARMGYDVSIVRRSCYVAETDKLTVYKGVKLKTLWAPHIKSLEAFVHTFISILWAKKQKADIIHIHAIGPALFAPLARLLGMKVVFTHHGPDYDRAKWSRFGKFILKEGERVGTRYSNEVIVISDVIQRLLIDKYNRTNSHIIFNGVTMPEIAEESEYIDSLRLKPRMYIFALGRFVEEKGFDLLIRAYSKLKNQGYKLVIAGDSDHETTYSKQLKELAKANDILLTGFIKGNKLQQLFSFARLFVLPSYHEGLPISLLEAMSYRLPVLVSNIPANKQIELNEDNFFQSGNEKSLLKELSKHLDKNFEPVIYDMSSYNWDQIASETSDVYKKLLNND